MKYFGGIEGGATHSHLIICQENGELVAEADGLSTNHWQIGIRETSKRIAEMVKKAKEKACIAPETKLSGLGLSLSGCEQEETNQKLEAELSQNYPNVSESYYICSDTLGSIFTASDKGGIVVIAGTGSNTLLRNPDGSTFSCGGWGHVLGDEGSAWFISNRAIKICFDYMDNLKPSPFPIDCVWKNIQEHFDIKTRFDLLTHCYEKFEKCFYAGLCKKLANSANQGDALCKLIFEEAGCDIAKNIQAVLPRVNKDLVEAGNLNVICVGSVWKSWELLKDGFVKQISLTPMPYSLSLNRSIKSVAFGACYLGADNIQFPLPRNYADNIKTFYCHKDESALAEI